MHDPAHLNNATLSMRTERSGSETDKTDNKQTNKQKIASFILNSDEIDGNEERGAMHDTIHLNNATPSMRTERSGSEIEKKQATDKHKIPSFILHSEVRVSNRQNRQQRNKKIASFILHSDETDGNEKRGRMLKCCFTSIETVGLVGTGAQDGHLDFHTAPEL